MLHPSGSRIPSVTILPVLAGLLVASTNSMARPAQEVLTKLSGRGQINVTSQPVKTPVTRNVSTFIVAMQSSNKVLELGKTIERQLTGGESHSYSVSLTQGQYLHVVVSQNSIDVILAVSGPDGKQMFEIDNAKDTKGTETVSLVAESGGKYQVEVRPSDKNVKRGGYSIRIDELRLATAEDRSRVTVQRELEDAKRLDDEFGRLYGRLQYEDALSSARRSLAIREKVLDAYNPAVAVSLNEMALAYYAERKYTEAEPLATRAVSIYEKSSDTQSTGLASSLNTLALIYHAQREFDKAELLYLRVLSLTEKNLGTDNLEVAQSLDLLALLYAQKGQYAQAIPLYQRSLGIREKALDANNTDIVETLNSLAELYRLMGQFDKAEPLYLRGLAIREKVLGPEDPLVAVVLSSLASFYYMKGAYVKAVPLFRRALDIREKKLKPDDPLLAESLNDLTYLNIQMGNYVNAESNYIRALDIVKNAYGPEHPIVATAIGNLAELYRATGEWRKAEPLYKQSLAMREKLLGPEHPQVAESLNNFANFYQRTGDYASAEPLQSRALAIDEKRLGSDHPDVAMDLNNLAVIYSYEGQHAKAVPLSQRALAIREKIFSPEHPLIAESLISLSILYDAMGDTARAMEFLRRGLESRERAIELIIQTGSEQQKALFLESLSNEVNGTISFQVRSAQNSLEARSLALTTILRRKGRALDAMAEEMSTLRRHLKAEDRTLFDQLQEARSHLAQLVFEGSGQDNPKTYQDEVNKLRDEIERFESQIVARSTEYRSASLPLTIERVQELIPPNAALVELTAYHLFEPKAKTDKERFGAQRYAAYVMRRQGVPTFVDLGEAAPINENIVKLRAALRNPGEIAKLRQYSRAVDKGVMAPIRNLLGDSRMIFLSTDGALTLVPFGALLDEENRYLIEKYSLVYLTSGRDLLRLQTHAPSERPPVVMASPLFDWQAAKGKPGASADRSSDKGRRGDFQQHFEPLTSTFEEGTEIGKILGVKPLVSESASETALKQVRGPRILHIATHGFFISNQKQDTADPLDNRNSASFSLAVASAAGDNPLLRAGLALAGANHLQGGNGEDGILTAMEAAGLDLWGTKLVALSACETGVGEIQNGEGVYGLRRAFLLAGAESQVISLWKVTEDATQDLMVRYYRRLMAGESRSEALRQVQLEMLKEKDYSHPYFWASFIESGDWRSLGGK